MQRLDHPHICKLYDSVETETQVILVMEYISGGSSYDLLKTKPHRRMTEIEAVKIYTQLYSALKYLH